MSFHVAISVMSRDRVGIIADVSRPIVKLKGNIDAISQTVLRGYFALVLNVDFPKKVAMETIRKEIEATTRSGDLAVVVLERDPAAASTPVIVGGEKYVLTMTMKKDRPGIVNHVTDYLAGHGINILDFYAFREEGRFVIISIVRMPPRTDVRQIQIDIEDTWKGGDMAVSLKHQNVFMATGEVEFSHLRTESDE